MWVKIKIIKCLELTPISTLTVNTTRLISLILPSHSDLLLLGSIVVKEIYNVI
jgi:hypothetical protein